MAEEMEELMDGWTKRMIQNSMCNFLNEFSLSSL